MKITIEIPDEEIRQEVFNLLTSRLANEIFTERWGRDERTYKKELADAVKAAVREHEDELLERAIPRAAEYMGSRGLKKLVAKITEGGEP